MVFNRILKILIIFCVIILLSGVWFYWRNIYSRGSLKLEILAPNEVELAGEFEYLVKYKNNGSITLEDAKLTFEYPENAILEEGKSLRQEINLEDIYSGEEKTVSFKARILGEENDPQTARVNLSWRPKNLKARFDRTTSFTSVVKTVPIDFNFDFPSKLETGREINLRINYKSNASFPISNLRIKINYPSDFQFLESKPRGINQDEWEIGLLNKNEGGRIEVKGKIAGDVSTQKIFKAQLVSWQGDSGIVLREAIKGIELVSPSIYLSWQVNGSPQYSANPGDYLHYEIFFKNIGDNALEDLFLRVSLESGIFDFKTVKADSGQLQEEGAKGTIFWDKTSVPQLRLLAPLEEGRVEFWVKLKSDLSTDSKNPFAEARINLSKATEQIITKINSQVIITQKGYYNQGVFENIGPIPPQVGSSTTYNISWQIKSLLNDLKNTKVRAVLPVQSRLTDQFQPKEAKLFFDPVSREIVWDIGDLIAGQFGSEINFQIAFTPTLDQKGQTPIIISEARMVDEDTWTGKMLEASAPAITTALPDDPLVTDQQGIVQ